MMGYTLIGRGCTHGNVFSRPPLMVTRLGTPASAFTLRYALHLGLCPAEFVLPASSRAVARRLRAYSSARQNPGKSAATAPAVGSGEMSIVALAWPLWPATRPG